GIKGGRGHGLRGGRGNAGLHKHKVMHMLKYDPDHFGRRGFKRPQKVLETVTTINVSELQERLNAMVKAQQAVKKGDAFEINLTELGIDKLLGSGRVASKMVITVGAASEKAVSKILKAGGKVILPEGEAKTSGVSSSAPTESKLPAKNAVPSAAGPGAPDTVKKVVKKVVMKDGASPSTVMKKPETPK
ncbi:MAG: uL15 family ribosomal protein, partial [Thermoplasmata archaeon]